jgi:hypothetical protein
MRLAAFGLAPIDAMFGTALIEKAATGMRRSAQGTESNLHHSAGWPVFESAACSRLKSLLHSGPAALLPP